MFSPNAHLTRHRVLQNVLGSQNNANEPSGNSSTEETLDPDVLSGVDQVSFYDLEELEDRYGVYMSSPFNFSTLCFIPEKISRDDPPEDINILDALPLAHPSTQHFSYHLRGLKALSIQLRDVECVHPALVAQRDALGNAINLDVKRLVSGAYNEYLSQENRSLNNHGIRIVQTIERGMRPYASALSTSVIVLTAVVHAIMGVSRESCNYILSALRSILVMVSSMQDTHSATFIHEHIGEIPTTLPTALHYLNIQPTLQLYTACPKCSALYREGTGVEIPKMCTQKDISGSICAEDLFSTHYRGGKTRQRPTRRYSHHLLEDWLAELLLRPGVEEMLESTSKPSPSESTLNDVWDAPYMRSFACSRSDQPPEELNLTMLLFHDFLNPFGNKAAGKLRSIGCFFMVCLDLPPDVRYDTSYAYLVSMVPGPEEPKVVDLYHFVRPIAQNVEELSSPGVWISKTHKHPNGRKVRVNVPLASMDTPAARAFGGFAPHSHTCFCYLCTAKLHQIHHNNLSAFQLQTMDVHREHVAHWRNAATQAERDVLYKKHGVRDSDWLRFEWWDAFSGLVVGPMHWTKNILDKQLRHNMGWSWTVSMGLPPTPPLLRAISELEYDWGQRALLCLSSQDFLQSKLPSPLVRYLCRQRGVFETGLSSEYLLSELDNWRVSNNIIDADGELTPQACMQMPSDEISVSVARAHYYLSQASKKSQVTSHASLADLGHLCRRFGLSDEGPKDTLAERLLEYHSRIRIPNIPETVPPSKASKNAAVLGMEVLTEVQDDMGRTSLPRWLKHPPKNFATVAHGKLQAEEYKSLALVSMVITLVRLWGHLPTGPFRERLDHFLHLMISVRILAFQSLTEADIQSFEYHYGEYIAKLTTLYPNNSRVSVQHMGLHIPTFLRQLGPSTRYSESTCEQYNGLLQDISTNFKFGDLELTLHREFVMASRLKGLIHQESFTKSLGEFGEVTRQYMLQKVPGFIQPGWKTSHSENPTILSDDALKVLSHWATSQRTRDFARRLFVCSSIRRGNVFYAPCDKAVGDSCVLFCPLGQQTPIPGRIDLILEEPRQLIPPPGEPRIVLLVRPFVPLEPGDSFYDPYWNNPIIGQHGAAIAKLYYDEVQETAYVIEPRDLVTHVAVCNYHDPEASITRPTVVVLSLDLKHKRYT